MEDKIVQRIILAMDMPGKIVSPIFQENEGKTLNVEEMKEVIVELVAKIKYNGNEEKVTKDEIEELWQDMKDADVWKAMDIKVPSTHIKYANEDSELHFASEKEAIQYLSNELGKRIVVED